MELDFAMQKFDGFSLIKKRNNRNRDRDVLSSDHKDINRDKDNECFLKISTKPLEVFTGTYGISDVTDTPQL